MAGGFRRPPATDALDVTAGVVIAGIPLALAALARLGPGAAQAVITGESAPVKGWLQLLYFVSGILVAVVGGYALRFASAQARESRLQAQETANARVSSLYLELIRNWDDERFARSRSLIQRLAAFHEAHADAMPDSCRALPDYIAEALLWLRETDRVSYAAHAHTLDALEQIGLLCRMEMMNLDMVLEIFGGQIAYAKERLEIFCRRLQQETRKQGYANPGAVYANTLWLFSRANDYQPFEFTASPDR